MVEMVDVVDKMPTMPVSSPRKLRTFLMAPTPPT